MLIRDIEPQQDLSAKLTLTAEAPGVHTAEFGPIPPYDPVVTVPTKLPAPEIISVESDARVMLVTASRTLSDRELVHAPEHTALRCLASRKEFRSLHEAKLRLGFRLVHGCAIHGFHFGRR